jgi:cytochrome c biogenesis protein CcdA/thiol-disulfide isomerase/thioredoxin
MIGAWLWMRPGLCKSGLVGGMLLFFLAYIGGVLTILSPCILPVLPFVCARSDQPFRKSGLPLLAGMAVTFALVASLATVGGGWVIRANQFGRYAALALFGIFGLTLLFPSLADRFTRPLVRLGNRFSAGSGTESRSVVLNSFLLGIGTGLLWAPCAGPILGLILTGAALSGASAGTALLLLAYAAGAATSLAVALLAGGRVFAAMKRGLGAEEWIRRALGVAILAGVIAVALGLDRGVLTELSLASTGGLEQRLLDRFGARNQDPNNAMSALQPASMAGPMRMPDLSGDGPWINTPNSSALTPAALHGKVVLVDFWTYSCINCLRTLPYLKAWNAKYKDSGLVIIGVHTPEFPFEKDEANVRKAVSDLGVTYPVVMDNDYRIWRAFNNQYWPAHYFVDAKGVVRFHHFGEGGYAESEQWIRDLLKEANGTALPDGATKVEGSGAEAASDSGEVLSPETYVGYERAKNFASPGGFEQDDEKFYAVPKTLTQNQWALGGDWQDGGQIAALLAPMGEIVYRFHARDLHLVLGPGKDGKPVRFRITIDGKAPGADHGVDTDAEGNGTVKENRLYQLVRQHGEIRDRSFRIEFLDAGVEAFAFTFG